MISIFTILHKKQLEVLKTNHLIKKLLVDETTTLNQNDILAKAKGQSGRRANYLPFIYYTVRIYHKHFEIYLLSVVVHRLHAALAKICPSDPPSQ